MFLKTIKDTIFENEQSFRLSGVNSKLYDGICINFFKYQHFIFLGRFQANNIRELILSKFLNTIQKGI